MDSLRDRLIAKIDDLLLQATTSQDLPEETEITIEANIQVLSGVKSSNRISLESVRLGQLRNQSLRRETVRTVQPSTTITPLDRVQDQHTRGKSCPEADLSAASSDLTRNHGLPSPHDSVAETAPEAPTRVTRRNIIAHSVGIGNSNSSNHQPGDLTPPRSPSPDQSHSSPHEKQQSFNDSHRRFPKRRKVEQPPKLEQSTVEKLIEGIWEQIHNPKSLALGQELSDALHSVLERTSPNKLHAPAHDFSDVSRHCRQITTGSRTLRAFEVIIQAHWVDCYNARLQALRETRPELRSQEHNKMVMTEACTAFSWSERELRNRMGIWKGYREIKDAAGWCALIFAGPGIYRFCKYRLGFDQEAMSKFQSLKVRAEVAADTLQPQWRQLLALVGEHTQIHWRGHPHNWSVSKRKDILPLPLRYTYRQWDPDFSFDHLEESVVDKAKWVERDPRRCEDGPEFYCKSCGKRQSLLAEENECECFPNLYSPNPRIPCPVQVYQTENGRNNGILSCCSFERGVAVGEFVGLITKGLADVDVMQSQAGDNEPFQIWQGRCGNYTRFINHSCQPNCQFETFTWLGIQRIIVVSKGVLAGKEITVDYSGRYWEYLEKTCLCGEPSCRYKGRQTLDKNVRQTSS